MLSLAHVAHWVFGRVDSRARSDYGQPDRGRVRRSSDSLEIERASYGSVEGGLG